MGKLNYRQIPFGLSLGRMSMDPASVPDFLAPNVLDAIEIPAECFLHENPVFRRRLASCKFTQMFAGSLMAKDLTRDIPFVAENYRREFVNQAEIVIQTLSEKDVSAAVLAFDMRRVLGNPDAEAAALEIVHSLAPALYRFGFSLLIPYRVPFGGERQTAPLMAQFLRNTLSGQVKMSLELHPFEIPPDANRADMLGMLAFETVQTVLVYDADCGNHLTAEDFKPWAEQLDAMRFRGTYLLSPKSIRNRMAIPEADSFAKMVSDLRNE